MPRQIEIVYWGGALPWQAIDRDNRGRSCWGWSKDEALGRLLRFHAEGLGFEVTESEGERSGDDRVVTELATAVNGDRAGVAAVEPGADMEGLADDRSC